MLKKWIGLIVFIGLSSLYGQSENSWDKKAAFGGLKREKAVAFTIGDLGYVGCGVDTSETTFNDLWQYDPLLDSWTQLASMPASARRNAVGMAIGDKGYVGTGLDLDDGVLGSKLKDFWEYNPIANDWTAKADFPGGGDTGVYQATAFSALGKGYVVGGKIGSNAYLNEMWQYDPVTDSWIGRTPFPGGVRYQMMSFVVEDKAIVGMGTDNDVLRKDLHQYNPATNTWIDLPDFPGTERTQSSTFTIGSKGFLVFGSDGGLKDELWEYNFYSETWSLRAAFPGGGRISGIAFSIGQKGYAGLGKGTTGKKQTFYEYTPIGALSLSEEESLPLSFYPNPLIQQANLVLPEKFTQGAYAVYNLTGEMVKKENFLGNSVQVDRDALPSGYYQLVIFDSYGIAVGTKKIMVL